MAEKRSINVDGLRNRVILVVVVVEDGKCEMVGARRISLFLDNLDQALVGRLSIGIDILSASDTR